MSTRRAFVSGAVASGALGIVGAAAAPLRGPGPGEGLLHPAMARPPASPPAPSAPMDGPAWERFLQRWSREIVASREYADQLPPDVVASGWLGFPGVSEEAIRQAEAPLGATLPPSYRAFLKVTDGWRTTTPFIERLWPTAELAWFRERRRDRVDGWRAGASMPGGRRPVPDSDYFVYGPGQAEYTLRPEYLETALEISDEGDSAIYILNPKVVTPAGEWEAWFLASWLPGARRHRSFQDLMLAEYAAFKGLT